MEIKTTFSILPIYGQVAILDAETADIPEWKTGNESYVAAAQAILVATQADTAGRVTVHVSTSNDEESRGEPKIFSGTISIPSKKLQVGNIISGELTSFDLGASEYSIHIYANRIEEPSEIRIVLD